MVRRADPTIPGQAALAGCLIVLLPTLAATASPTDSIKQSPAWAVGVDSKRLDDVVLSLDWEGDIGKPTLRNTGRDAVRVREVVIRAWTHGLPPTTALYGEGLQMLSQTGGTLGKPDDIGYYSDRDHYKAVLPNGATAVVYGLLTLSPQQQPHMLLGFTSCRRFVGKFIIRPERIDMVLETDDLELAAGRTWELEELMVRQGPQRWPLLEAFGRRIAIHHPRPPCKKPPAGWCSWYCFGPGATAADIRRNLDFIAGNAPELRYIQIDDGYQSAMGDWLTTGPAFGGGVQRVLAEIRERGFEPAIWVAPFIAEEKSEVFRLHPDWFIKDANGKPLRSDTVSFGGWRRGPWYCLDGTHPEVQTHFRNVFSTMRRDWGCTYFKLDANFWGMMHGGKFHDPAATRVDAYRRGMQAVRQGADDAFILGCNHPLWASAGLIHGSRQSMDIARRWEPFKRIARENLLRNWTNGLLWWNDPDCILLTGDLSDDEFRFHATSVYAAGGMVLAGDDMPKLSPTRLATLKRVLTHRAVPAAFLDDSLRVGMIRLPDQTQFCVFNWEDTPQDVALDWDGTSRLRDFWTGNDLGVHEGKFVLRAMPPHSAQIVVAVPQ